MKNSAQLLFKALTSETKKRCWTRREVPRKRVKRISSNNEEQSTTNSKWNVYNTQKIRGIRLSAAYLDVTRLTLTMLLLVLFLGRGRNQKVMRHWIAGDHIK